MSSTFQERCVGARSPTLGPTSLLLPCLRYGLTSMCGPVQELVQVESLAQVGVQLLLFTLGLEFSLSKLRAVRSVALLGAPPS